MYHAFIRSQTRKAFADLTAGRVERHSARFHPKATLRVDRDGSAVLLRGRDTIRASLENEFPPGRHRFTIDDVVVSGWPGRTRVAVLWSDAAPEGPGRRSGMNHIVIAWGRVVDERLFAGAPDR